MTKKGTQEPSKKKHISNTGIQNLWIDNIEVALREDGICLLRMSTELPEGVFEQSRVFVNRTLLERLMNGMAEALDYYPERPVKKEKDRDGND